ncbi:hypothetical protein C8R44DRAFT_864448 [Mycena epipterygia]|nr:hypothetical protein C8R44DRAFT_864448 [Mycena epipterygia]
MVQALSALYLAALAVFPLLRHSQRCRSLLPLAPIGDAMLATTSAPAPSRFVTVLHSRSPRAYIRDSALLRGRIHHAQPVIPARLRPLPQPRPQLTAFRTHARPSTSLDPRGRSPCTTPAPARASVHVPNRCIPTTRALHHRCPLPRAAAPPRPRSRLSSNSYSPLLPRSPQIYAAADPPTRLASTPASGRGYSCPPSPPMPTIAGYQRSQCRCSSAGALYVNLRQQLWQLYPLRSSVCRRHRSWAGI